MKSVRVNLSVPGDIDKLLFELAERMSMSKAAVVMEAVREYLPEMRRKLSAQRYPGWQREKVEVATEGATSHVQAVEVPLSRQQRRALERQNGKGSSS